MLLHDDDSEFCTLVFCIEVNEVDNPHHNALFVLNHHANLTIDIDVVLRIRYVVMQRVTAVRNIRRANVPQSAVVLNAIKGVQILWFHGSLEVMILSIE